MEPWRYTALTVQFNNLQQKLLSTMHTTKDNLMISAPMDDDLYNNNINVLKGGVKRKASSVDLQPLQNKNGKRCSVSDEWCMNPSLKLDVYTQTDCLNVSDNRAKSLSHVYEIVEENNKKLENVERFLVYLENKIETFLSCHQRGDLVERKDAEGVVAEEHSMMPEGASPVATHVSGKPTKGGGSPVETNIAAPSIRGKSPAVFSPSVLHVETPVTKASPSGWSHTFHPGADPADYRVIHNGSQESVQQRKATLSGKGTEYECAQGDGWTDCRTIPTALKSKMEPSTRNLERSTMESDRNLLVPVIISVGVKNKKNVTTEVPLHNLLDGSLCTLQGMEHVSYSHGCWLGDKTNPNCRVWYCGDPRLIHRAEVSGSNPAKLSLNLLEALFVRDEMAASNINGARGRDLLDPIKIKAIQVHINHKFPIEPGKEELRWQFLKPRIDSKCRAQRRLQREQQARLEKTPQGMVGERPFRSRLRVDPKEKDELLYGYSRTLDLGLSTTETQEAVSELPGKASSGDHLQPPEVIVEVSGTPVTFEEPVV